MFTAVPSLFPRISLCSLRLIGARAIDVFRNCRFVLCVCVSHLPTNTRTHTLNTAQIVMRKPEVVPPVVRTVVPPPNKPKFVKPTMSSSALDVTNGDAAADSESSTPVVVGDVAGSGAAAGSTAAAAAAPAAAAVPNGVHVPTGGASAGAGAGAGAGGEGEATPPSPSASGNSTPVEGAATPGGTPNPLQRAATSNNWCGCWWLVDGGVVCRGSVQSCWYARFAVECGIVP